MGLELVAVPTEAEPLDGIIYYPDRGPVLGSVLLFHGNTANFYTGPPRFLPPKLVAAGFVCFAFNRRGHDILTTLEEKRLGGGAFQTAAEGIADSEAASAYLARQGFDQQAVVGHSNGGMLGARFAASHRELRALVLLSAHAGGEGLYSRSCEAGSMAGTQGDEYLERARSLIANGNDDALLLMPHWWNLISAQSLVDREDNTPDLLKDASVIECPTLFLVGDREPSNVYPAEEFARRTAGSSEVRILENCGHWYVGMKETVTDTIVEWLTAVFVSKKSAGAS